MIYCCSHAVIKAQRRQKHQIRIMVNLTVSLDVLKKNYSHRCIVGDFNLRDTNWSMWTNPCSENSTETSFVEAVRDSYLYQHVKKVTRRRGNDDPSMLDLIFELIFTDEAMQVSDIQHHSPWANSILLKLKRVIAKGDYVSMRIEFENSKWLRTYTALNGRTTIDDKWLSLKSELSELKETFVTKLSISGKSFWMNKGCFPINKRTQEAIKNKNRTYRAWMRSTVLNYSESSRLEDTKARNKVRTMVRRAKREFEKGIAAQAKTNPKYFWSHTRRNLKTKSGVEPLLANVEDNNSQIRRY